MTNAELVESNGTAASRTPEDKAIFWDRRFRASYKTTVEAAWKCGRALLEVRKKKAHGQWVAWLDSVGINYTRANRCMALARVEISRVLNFPSMTQTLAAVSSVQSFVGIQPRVKEKALIAKDSIRLGKTKAPARKEIEQLHARVLDLENTEKDLRTELKRAKQSINRYKKTLSEKNKRIEELEERLARTNGHIEKPRKATRRG